MGGVSGERALVANSPSNLVVLCGSATSPGGCHGWAESNITEAQAEGLVLMQHENPADVPVTLHFGRVYLRDDGGYEHTEER